MPGNDASTPLSPQAGEPQELDLLKWLHVLAEHRWFIAGVTGAVVIVAALYVFLATPLYSATATVYVQSQGRQPLGYNPTGSGSWMEEQKFYNSQEAIIRSEEVMQEVVDRLGLQNHPGFIGAKDPAQVLMGMVKVENVRESALYKITVTAPYRKDVARWANAVAEAYRDKTLRDAVEYLGKANELMLAEARRMQEEYIQQQAKMANSLQASGSYFPQNQKDILDKRIEALELKLNEVTVKESEVGALVNQLRSASAVSGQLVDIPGGPEDPSLQAMVTQYNQLRQELAKLSVRFTPKYPEVQDLRARVQKQAQLILGTYENQLAALRAEEQDLRDQLAQVKKQGLAFVEGASREEALSSSGSAIKKYMDLLYDKMRELNVSSSLLSSNVRIVDHALPPGGPIKPNKRMTLLMALMLGLMLSVGSVVGYQYLDTSVKSVEDIEERLGLNLLSMVPALTEETLRPGTEAFQTLRTALIYASQNQQNNVILVTSAAPREGKTTIVANLAKVLAATGDRVIALDCDLRRPALARAIHPADDGRSKGLTNYLATRESRIEDFIQNGPHPNLFFIASGPLPPNPPELFSMKRFQGLIQELRTTYQWVLLDSPPCLSITDAQILAGMAELVVLTAKYRKTKMPLLERATLNLTRLGAKVAGVVLNGVETHSSYYYDYYSSHHYYTTGTEPKRFSWLFGGGQHSTKGKGEAKRPAGGES